MINNNNDDDNNNNGKSTNNAPAAQIEANRIKSNQIEKKYNIINPPGKINNIGQYY